MAAKTACDASNNSNAGPYREPVLQAPRESVPKLQNVIIAGGVGGLLADVVLHPWDTVKTRLQGQHIRRYRGMLNAFAKMAREEKVRGFYGGVIPAAVGSLVSTTAYFGTYEAVKRSLLSTREFTSGDNLSRGSFWKRVLVYLLAGSVGDIAASVFYVPSEVLKTRFQLQGRHNNKYSVSTFNYRNLPHAIRTIYLYGGYRSFYRGYIATLCRDVPFSAFQFAFYELLKEFLINQKLKAASSSFSAQLDYNQNMFVGAIAGGLAGALTNPLDVVKTQLQTRKIASTASSQSSSISSIASNHVVVVDPSKSEAGLKTTITLPRQVSSIKDTVSEPALKPILNRIAKLSSSELHHPSLLQALYGIYEKHGLRGYVLGIGPRTIWAGLQSAIMFSVFEYGLQTLEAAD